MKAVFASLVLFGSLAQAMSLHPCTPTVRAQDSVMSCHKNGKGYSITVETLMSRPSAMCSGANHYEYKTAKVVISSSTGAVIGRLTINDADFSYKLGTGDGKFRSNKFNIDLNNCTSPLHGGGFSVGN